MTYEAKSKPWGLYLCAVLGSLNLMGFGTIIISSWQKYNVAF